MGYVPALDGWRGVSILLVLASHVGIVAGIPGGLGVTIFFFVSGLLITGQLLDEHQRHGRIDLRRFYWRRALRLMPASTAFVVVAGAAFVACGGRVPPTAWLAAFCNLANYAQLATHLFDTNISGLPHPFVILWSLAIEEQFYLVWPVLLLVLLVNDGRRAALLWALVCCLVFCLAWRCHLAPICGHLHDTACGPHGDDWIAKSTETRADSLAFGAVAAVIVRSSAARRVLTVLRSPAVVGAAACLLLLTVMARGDWFRETLRYTLQGASLLVLVPASTLAASSIGAMLSQPALLAIGRLSYGLYLWHWLALMLVGRTGFGRVGGACTFVAVTAVLTLASWFAIERPVMALRRRAGSHGSPALVVRSTPALVVRSTPAMPDVEALTLADATGAR